MRRRPILGRTTSSAWRGWACWAAASLISALPAAAGNGHLLHGVGAIQSSMGGSGVALPIDVLGALHGNPALLVDLTEDTVALGTEIIDASNAVESEVGPFHGRTEDAGDPVLVPALGFVKHRSSRLAIGFGMLGVAGLATSYPQDPTNPILAPQPFGLGQVYTSYELLEAPLAVSWRARPDLAVGVALVPARAVLAASPAGFASPDCASNGSCFFPSLDEDAAIGFGAQVGLRWRASDVVSVGFAAESEGRFERFEWPTTVANPALPTFGTARAASLRLNSPPMVSVGVALQLGEDLRLALDGRWVGFGSTDGFAADDPDPVTGQPRGLGWEDVLVAALGVDYRVSEALSLRAGLNVGENPIPDAVAMFNVASPAVFERHATLGLGYRLPSGLALELAYYHAFESSIEGPLLGSGGPVPGTRVRNEMSLDGVVLTLVLGLGRAAP